MRGVCGGRSTRKGVGGGLNGFETDPNRRLSAGSSSARAVGVQSPGRRDLPDPHPSLHPTPCPTLLTKVVKLARTKVPGAAALRLARLLFVDRY